MTFQQLRTLYFSQTLLWVLVGLGAVFSTVEYLHNRSLWVDEAGVAVNILEHSWRELLPSQAAVGERSRTMAGERSRTTVDYTDTAPTGFLLVEKLLSILFGDSEYALRLFPLLCGVLAMALFVKVAPIFLQPAAVPIAVLLLSTSEALITHATSLKQYSGDVFFALLLTWFTLYFLATRPTLIRMLLFGWLGALAIWFSHPIIFILASSGVGMLIVWSRRKDWPVVRLLCLTGAFWLASFGAKYLLVLRQVSHDLSVRQFWTTEFMPFLPASLSDFGWFLRTFFETIRYALQLPQGLPDTFARLGIILASVSGASPSVGVPLDAMGKIVLTDLGWLGFSLMLSAQLLTGCVVLLKRHRATRVFLFAPILLTLLASGFYKYPFGNRMILFLVPLLFLCFAEGAIRIVQQRRLIGIIMLSLLCVYPTAWAIYRLAHPRIHEHARPVMEYLKEQRRPNDVVYVYYGAKQVFAYYARRFDLPSEAVIHGIASRDDWLKYVDDLNQLRGQPRVWLFFSHAYAEEAFFLSYLDSIGKRQDAFQDVRAAVYLYDLR